MTSKHLQLTYEQRCQISALKKTACSQRKIAHCIGVSQSTISRELPRNSAGKQGYRHKQAQAISAARCKAASDSTKMTESVIVLIESRLGQEWSPEQISGWLAEEKGLLIGHEAICLHVWFDKQAGGDLYKHLRRQGKKYDKRHHGKSTRDQIKHRVSIDERSVVVDSRSRIIGGGGNGWGYRKRA